MCRMEPKSPLPPPTEPRPIESSRFHTPPLIAAALLVVVLWGVVQARPFLIPVCIAALLSFLMAPLVRTLQRLHAPNWVAVTISAVLMILPFVGLGLMLVNQGQELVDDFPSIMNSLQDNYSRFSQGKWGQRLNLSAHSDLSHLLQRVSSGAGKGVALLVGGLAALLNAGSQLALVIIFAIMMIASRVHLRRSGEKILANARSFRGAALLDEISTLIEKFLVARLLVVAIIGALSAVSLMAFGLKYSILLGAFVGLMTMVPAVGFLIAAIPVVIVALATGHSILQTAVMLGILIGINAVENNVLTPKLVGRSLNINALTSFLGLFAGGLLWGPWGMFLSVPILGVLRIVFSAIPGLQPWGELMAEREDKTMSLRLLRTPKKAA